MNKRILIASIFFLLMVLFLELNKNRITGWLLTAISFAGFVYLMNRLQMTFFTGLLCWLGWFAVFGLIVVLTWPPVRNVPASTSRNAKKTEIIKTGKGSLQGIVSDDGLVEIYAGIPYAKPPVGDLRWKEPQDPEPWEGVLQADTFAPMSMQPQNLPVFSSLARIIGYHDYEISWDDQYREANSEDSLYLNIWKPAGECKDLPVLVYIHGGSLQTGQPWYADYSGMGLAKENVIVVNMGYRLGVFGFFASEELAAESENHTTGNYGLLDQIKALEWVQNNIRFFGGDPDNVTVAGESAGAACVGALCTSPLARGLFQRAVAESSGIASVQPPHSFRTFDEALASGKKLMERYNAASVDDLRQLSAEELVAEASTQHHITIDGYVLTEKPVESYRKGIHNEQQLLHGFNSEESGPFILFDHAKMKNYRQKIEAYFGPLADKVLALYPAQNDAEADRYWAEIYGAVFFNYSHYCWNRLAVENDIPVYEYYFTRKNGRLGAWHSGEMVYCYGNIPEKSSLYDDHDRKLSGNMVKYWASFAEDGDPNHEGAEEWHRNTDSGSVMEFGDEMQMREERFLKLYEILDEKYGW